MEYYSDIVTRAEELARRDNTQAGLEYLAGELRARWGVDPMWPTFNDVGDPDNVLMWETWSKMVIRAGADAIKNRVHATLINCYGEVAGERVFDAHIEWAAEVTVSEVALVIAKDKYAQRCLSRWDGHSRYGWKVSAQGDGRIARLVDRLTMPRFCAAVAVARVLNPAL